MYIHAKHLTHSHPPFQPQMGVDNTQTQGTHNLQAPPVYPSPFFASDPLPVQSTSVHAQQSRKVGPRDRNHQQQQQQQQQQQRSMPTSMRVTVYRYSHHSIDSSQHHRGFNTTTTVCVFGPKPPDGGARSDRERRAEVRPLARPWRQQTRDPYLPTYIVHWQYGVPRLST